MEEGATRSALATPPSLRSDCVYHDRRSEALIGPLAALFGKDTSF